MALQVQVKSFWSPNLNSIINYEGENYDPEKCEEEIEDYVKEKLDAGWEIKTAVGGDTFITFVFTIDS